MTTGAILTAIAVETNKGGVAPTTNSTASMNTTIRAQLLNHVNRKYRALLSRPAAIHVRESTTTFDSADGTALYAIASAAKLHRVWETTNDRRLLPMTLDEYRSLEPDAASNEGTPTHFINAGYNSSRQPQVYLWPTPNAIITYSCDILAAITDLSLDADVPRLPEDFHDILVLAGLEEEYRKVNDARWNSVRADRIEREKDLFYWLAETASGSQTYGMEPPSSLGAWFESGS